MPIFSILIGAIMNDQNKNLNAVENVSESLPAVIDNKLDIKKEDSELQAHISIVRQTIEQMKKNPAYVREAFFISLLEAYDAIDETIKKRTIALNLKLLNLQKACTRLENIDKAFENRLLESIDKKLDLVVKEFDKKLERVANPIENTSANIKNMGMTVSRLNKQLSSNLEDNNALNNEIKNNSSTIINLSKFMPILIISNIVLILFIVFDKFF